MSEGLEPPFIEHLLGLALPVFVDEVLPRLERARHLELLLHPDLGADLPEAVAHLGVLDPGHEKLQLGLVLAARDRLIRLARAGPRDRNACGVSKRRRTWTVGL